MPLPLHHLAALALVSTACGSTVTGGGGGGDAVGATTGAGSPGGSRSAIALFAGEQPSIPCEAGRCLDEDALVLIADARGVTCTDPSAAPSSTPPSWSFLIGLPLAAQRVGVIDLFAEEGVYVAHGAAAGAADGGVVTASGGFGFSSGTLEILSIDDVAITFRVEGVTLDVGIPSDGEYTAPRCGASSWPAEAAASSGASSSTSSSGGG